MPTPYDKLYGPARRSKNRIVGRDGELSFAPSRNITIPSMRIEIEIRDSDTGETIGISQLGVDIYRSEVLQKIDDASTAKIAEFVSKAVIDRAQQIEEILGALYDVYISEAKKGVETSKEDEEAPRNEEARDITLDDEDTEPKDAGTEATKKVIARIEEIERRKKTGLGTMDDLPF